jgi:hypothetical protein
LPMQSSDDFIDRGGGVRGAVSSFRHTVPLLALTRVQQSRLESLLGSVAHAHSFQSSLWPPWATWATKITGNYYVARGSPAHKQKLKALLQSRPPGSQAL